MGIVQVEHCAILISLDLNVDGTAKSAKKWWPTHSWSKLKCQVTLCQLGLSMQAQKIRQLLRDRGLGSVRVGTVDDYQGQEERIIFISTVSLPLYLQHADMSASGNVRQHCAGVRVFLNSQAAGAHTSGF